MSRVDIMEEGAFVCGHDGLHLPLTLSAARRGL